MKSVLLAIALIAFPGLAMAETFQLPEDEPVVQLNLPTAWEPTNDDGWLEASSDDEELYIAFEVTDTADFEDSVKETIQYLVDEGVTVDEATLSKTPFEINGLKGVDVAWQGKDKDGPVTISLSVIQVTADKMLLLTYWSTPKGDADNAPTIRDIVHSIKAVEKE